MKEENFNHGILNKMNFKDKSSVNNNFNNGM